MSLAIAFQVDAQLVLSTDTSIAFMAEAIRRGHKVFCYEVAHLAVQGDSVYAKARSVDIVKTGKHVDFQDISTVTEIKYGDYFNLNLDQVNIIFIRQNPPFDIQYITSTYMIERAKVFSINNCSSIRNHPEKFLPLEFPEFIPKTLITEDASLIKSFFLEHQDIVLKPLYSFAGDDVIRLNNKINAEPIIELMLSKHNCPIISQKFCSNISEDKRIIVLDGKPLSAMRRKVISNDEIRTNLRFNSIIEKVDFSEKDYELCATVGPKLSELGLVFAGIDLLGDMMLEINVTSPTGMRQMNRLYHKNLEEKCWDVFEQKFYESKK